MNSRTHTKEEIYAKNVALPMLQKEPNLKSVTVKDVKITVVDGSLKTDWQMEEIKRCESYVEKNRQQEVENRANYLLRGHTEGVVDEMQLEDVCLKRTEDGLEIFDCWNS